MFVFNGKSLCLTFLLELKEFVTTQPQSDPGIKKPFGFSTNCEHQYSEGGGR